MAQDTIDKIINIQFNYGELVEGWKKTAQAVDDNKEALRVLKDEYKSGKLSAENYNQALLENKATQTALKNELRQYSKELQNNIKIETQASGSINQLRANISKLTAQYNALSGAEREGNIGRRLAADIKSQQEAVTAAEKALGNYRSQVGSYEEALRAVLPVEASQLVTLGKTIDKSGGVTKAFGLMTAAVGRMIKAALAFVATPLGAVLTAISVATIALVKNWDRLKESLGITAPIGSAKRAITDLNKALAENDRGMADQIVKFKQLQNAWNSLGNDMSSKNKFIKENKNAFDGLGVKITNVNDAENLLIANSEAFIESLKLRAQSTASYELAVETYKKAVVEQQKADERAEKSRAGYTEKGFEQLKKNLRTTSDALFNQAEAYIDLSAAREKDAKAILDNANIEEATQNNTKKGIKKVLTLEELQAKLREENTKKYVSAVNKQQQAVYKNVVKTEEEIIRGLKDMDKEWADSVMANITQKEEEYKNRLLKAQTQGGDTSAQNEMIRIAQEQVNILQDQLQDVEAFRAAYEAMGLSGVEIDNKRLEALKALKDAQKALQNAQNKAAEDEVKAQERSTQMSLQSAQQLAGALGNLAEAAGADAGLVAMLAIAESAAAMGAALHKAFSSSATVWDGIAGAVAAIATITTVISQIKSLNSSAADEKNKYRYAQGGLVTGPGTSTSDSIPARLSNGEAVMTARAVSDWGAMLSAMNVSSGGNAIQVSNLPQRNDGMRGMERMMERAMMNMPAPIVSVVDINKGQKRVRVQDNLGRLGRKKRA